MAKDNLINDKFDSPVTRALEILEHGRELTDADIVALRSDDQLREACRDVIAFAEVSQEEEDLTAIVEKERLRVMESINNRKRKKAKLIDWSYVRWGIAAAAAVLVVISLWNYMPQDNGTVTADNQSFTSIDSTLKDVVLTAENGEVLAHAPAKSAAAQLNFASLDASELEAEKVTVTVPRGKTYKLILADGTEAYMYPDSRLLFPTKFMGKERRVILYGEAYFNVAKDREHPFVIESARMETKVLGTQFHVSDYNDAARPCTVTLVEGSVNVKAEQESVMLKSGQQLAVKGSDVMVSKVDVTPYLKLIEGLFYFDNATLGDIMDFLGKWYGMDVEFKHQDKRSLNLRFIAEEDSGVNRVIDRLNSIEKVTVAKRGNTIVIE